MNENLNLVEVLKDCPKHTKLYSPLFGDCFFCEIRKGDFPIVVDVSAGSTWSFTKEGLFDDKFRGECLLYPSKNQRDWSKFVPSGKTFHPNLIGCMTDVLVRDSSTTSWSIYTFSVADCLKSLRSGKTPYKFCIPYNSKTFHLVNTTMEAPECYRYWEE